MVNWKEGNQAKYQSMNPGTKKSTRIELKGNAHDIIIKAQYQFGFRWHDVFTKHLEAPPNKYYAVTGNPSDIGWHELDNVGN
jgi:hypothetical protein